VKTLQKQNEERKKSGHGLGLDEEKEEDITCPGRERDGPGLAHGGGELYQEEEESGTISGSGKY